MNDQRSNYLGLVRAVLSVKVAEAWVGGGGIPHVAVPNLRLMVRLKMASRHD